MHGGRVVAVVAEHRRGGRVQRAAAPLRLRQLLRQWSGGGPPPGGRSVRRDGRRVDGLGVVGEELLVGAVVAAVAAAAAAAAAVAATAARAAPVLP